MAAPINVDRKLAAEVRRMTLDKIKRLFTMGVAEMSERELQLHDEVFKRLAGTVLPRLNEITGEEGGVIKLTFDPAFNGTTSDSEENSQESSTVQDNSGGPQVG